MRAVKHFQPKLSYDTKKKRQRVVKYERDKWVSCISKYSKSGYGDAHLVWQAAGPGSQEGAGGGSVASTCSFADKPGGLLPASVLCGSQASVETGSTEHLRYSDILWSLAHGNGEKPHVVG